MKRILACLLLVCSIQVVQAQIEKGKVLLGGQFAYTSSHTKNVNIVPPDYMTSSGAYHIIAGMAVKQNGALGVDFSYLPVHFGNYFANGALTNDRKLRNYRASIFYKQYQKLAGKFYVFGQGNIGYTRLHQFDETLSGNKLDLYDETGGFIAITPGISYNLFKKFQVELRTANLLFFSFNHTSNKQNRFSVSTGLQDINLGDLRIGFSFIL